MKTGFFNKLYSAVLCLILALCLSAAAIVAVPSAAMADKMDLTEIRLRINGGTIYSIPAYEANYVNNYFVSLRSLAKALKGTSGQFNFYNDDDGIYQIETGKPYDASKEPEFDEDLSYDEMRAQSGYMAQAAYVTMKDGSTVVYYTFADYTIEDLYMSILDVQLALDLYFDFEDGIYNVDTGEHFHADLYELDSCGYFDYLHSVLLGDATTGEVLFESKGDQAVPIASTTKLMTYFVIKRMMEKGQFSEDDIVTISKNAARLSLSDDSVIYMYEGEQTTVDELLKAMLIESSNESALALAEFAAGSEEKFVYHMNEMALILGMDSAVFYNPHGLPAFYEGGVTSMVENKMSAEDMFLLVRAILKRYPEIEEITSLRSEWLEYMWITVSTTNALMNNMPDVFGLKTGTTDAAGKCLVAARRMKIEGEEHILVSVVMGAEFNSDRVEISELLLKSIGDGKSLVNTEEETETYD